VSLSLGGLFARDVSAQGLRGGSSEMVESLPRLSAMRLPPSFCSTAARRSFWIAFSHLLASRSAAADGIVGGQSPREDISGLVVRLVVDDTGTKLVPDETDAL